MTRYRTSGNQEFPRSQASIAGHPIHPMLIPFPVTFTASVLISDIVALVTQDAFWLRTSYFLLIAAIVTGAAAAVAGSIDFWTNRHIRSLRIAWAHMIGNAILLLLLLINVIGRTGTAADDIFPGGLLLSVVSAALLLVSGWLGGEMVYHHRVGVHDAREMPHDELTRTDLDA
jgi:uncharacterized membrane protein